MPRPGGEAMIVRSEIVGAGCARRRVVSTDARSEDHVVKSTTRYTRPFSGLNWGLAILMVAAVLEPALAGDSKAAPNDSSEAGPSTEVSRGYVFSEDWFSWNIPVWELQLASFVDRPETHYLEIGVFEGRSMLWALDHVLTHPSSRATGIDPQIPEVLESNLEKSGHGKRVRLIRGSSQIELRRLPLDSIDIIYIDGSHTADDVLADAVLSWDLLKVGGVLIFDDYEWDGSFITGEGPMPASVVPRAAIDAFLFAYANEIDLLHRAHQVIVRKREDPCAFSKGSCSPVGSYTYLWATRELVRGQGGAAVELSRAERDAIEAYLLSGARPEPARPGAAVCKSLLGRFGRELAGAMCP
jgi:predicted O-methyltransferase YrrM